MRVAPAVEECCLVSSRKAERRTGDNKHRRRRSLKKGKKKQGPAAMRRGQGSTRAAKGQYEGLTVSDILQHPLAKRFVQRTGEVGAATWPVQRHSVAAL